METQDDAGVDAAPPSGEINVYPDPVQFGNASMHVDTMREVTVLNVGEGDLTVTNIVVLENDDLDEYTAAPYGSVTLVIAPGSTEVIGVTLRPEDAELDFGELEITSDDPVNPVVTVRLESEYKGTPTLEVCVLDDASGIPEPFVDCYMAPGTQTPLIDYGVLQFSVPADRVVAIRNGADGNSPLIVQGATVTSTAPAIENDFSVRLFEYDTDGVTEIDLTPPIYLSAGDPALMLDPDLIYAEVTFGANVDGIVTSTQLVLTTNDPGGDDVPISAAISGCPQDYWDLNDDPSDGCEYHCVYTGPEQCDSGYDDNCSGDQDEEGALGCTIYYYDEDNDLFGMSNDYQCLCGADGFYRATTGNECDDANNLINPAATEVCDGLDNDCNPSTTEDFGDTTCGLGICENTVENCIGGVTQSCNPMQGAVTEVCDGNDNDCNGSTDEGLGSTTCGLGACNHTIDNCINGVPQSCNSMQGASGELCDNIDNDCDGIIDDGLGTTTCGLGVCNHTIDNCVGGVTQVCNAMDGSSAEVCDGQDNDCDGVADDGLGTITCGLGVCDHTIASCIGGTTQVCDPMEGASSSDLPDPSFIDENCDGIDGDFEMAITVTTSGSNFIGCGTSPSTPCETINYGIARANATGRSEVYIMAGIYNEVVVMHAGVSLYGGYNSSWVRDSRLQAGHAVTIIGGYDSAVGQYLTLRASSLSGTMVVANLFLTGPDAATTGRSSYVAYLTSTSGLSFESVTFDGGDGANGGSGSSGSVGAVGGSGVNGGSGGDGSSCCGYGGAGGNGCSIYNGGVGGRGGYGDANGSGGAAGTGPFGAGGTGGAGDGNDWCISGCDDAGTGGVGSSGGTGSVGSHGSGGGNSGYVSLGFWYGSSGSSGGTGQPGGGVAEEAVDTVDMAGAVAAVVVVVAGSATPSTGEVLQIRRSPATASPILAAAAADPAADSRDPRDSRVRYTRTPRSESSGNLRKPHQ